ncbi:hypothetical protein KNE206_73880 [Kitasatospora sp. NE20-6]|uniref:hypothetical protein n=1 Tax=Kitasatospora sp. NE20-6 TaxID=2859066 RepID=UPI0034DC76D3
MPDSFPRPRQVAALPATARVRERLPLLLALLAALAVLLSHALDSQHPAAHPAAAHTTASQPGQAGHESHSRAEHGHTAHPAAAQQAPATAQPPRQDDGPGHDHGTHNCQTGHVPQPSLLEVPAPVTDTVLPTASTCGHRPAPADADPAYILDPARSQVLRV